MLPAPLPLLFLLRAVKPELQLLRRLSPAGGEGEESGARGVVGANPHSATVWVRGERRRENGPKRPEFAALRDTLRTSFRSTVREI